MATMFTARRQQRTCVLYIRTIYVRHHTPELRNSSMVAGFRCSCLTVIKTSLETGRWCEKASRIASVDDAA
eukprot:636632-Rhodomonas_salina.1